MSTSDRSFFDRWFGEVWNKGNYDVAYEVIDPDFTVHGAGGQDIKQGPDGVVGLVKVWRAAFPDGQMIIDDGIFEGEFAALRTTWVGTQTGEFYGVPPSGRRVSCTSIGFDRVRNGKVTEGWGELDMLGFMQRMGALPPIGPQTDGEWHDNAGRSRDAKADPAASKAALLRYREALTAGDDAAVRAAVNESQYVDHNPSTGPGGLDATFQVNHMLRGALPDLRITVDAPHVIAQADLAFARWTITGTHTGDAIFGTAPSGKSVSVTGSEIVRVANGRVSERWLSVDLLMLLQQTGVLPSMGG